MEDRGGLKQQEIRHLHHRWAVLCSFIDVENDLSYRGANGDSLEGRIYRGCKDGAIATCRALSERFGIKMSSQDWAQLQDCNDDFKGKIRSKLADASELMPPRMSVKPFGKFLLQEIDVYVIWKTNLLIIG